MEKLLLVDGHALMHRAYHALPAFKTKKGIPTNVLYGFFSMLHKAVVDFQPNHLLVCFDTPATTFRNKLLKTYQAQRPKADDDFIIQIPFVKKGLDFAHIARMEKDGFEADDLIGTITHYYKENGITVFILSGDKDILQLVDHHIYVISPQIGFAKTKIYSPQEVREKMGVDPKQIPDYKAIAGDPSDNYIGAKGIGPKTTVKLLSEYKTLDNLLAHINTMQDSKIKGIIQKHLKEIQIAKQLAQIVVDVPLDFNLEKTQFSWFNEDLKKYLTEFEMFSIIKRLFERKHEISKEGSSPPKKEKTPQMNLF